MDVVGGWQLDENFGIYRISVRIINPETKNSVIKFCLFDTGFSGYLGLDNNTIASLNLKKIGMGKGFTVNGFIEYQNYEAIAEIVDNEEKPIGKIQMIDTETEETIIPIQEFNLPIMGVKARLVPSTFLTNHTHSTLLFRRALSPHPGQRITFSGPMKWYSILRIDIVPE